MFGEQLKTLRISHSLNQVDLAKMLNVSKQTVSNWENSNIMPSVDKLREIAIYFSCSTDYLLELNENNFLIETSDITAEQIAHIQQLIKDIQEINKRIKNKS
ncbi:helix-turn-helix domain-containing protein [[Clostridium] fimetarium]|uniref:DNA-binding transcriptional regulator, XRE-family HTH domain n=1 Tax=[Clostridium] fimetarium TaxID=99656 RepID=A0A1I0Q122_9FIRM|nr:helix-turn-helix transcriptional regulator [[Clostridium] fimetarium]SEW20213.1 DNA-binding transcriptional regulator, XRE-family HTH domain [[Clostridium] fimetarium]